jgi:hypothetical protein
MAMQIRAGGGRESRRVAGRTRVSDAKMSVAEKTATTVEAGVPARGEAASAEELPSNVMTTLQIGSRTWHVMFVGLLATVIRP